MCADRSALPAGVVALVLVSAPAPLWAAGFAVASQGAGALGIAGSATARLDLGDAGFYNPAAWAMREGFQGALGATTIVAGIAHRDALGSETTAETPVSVPPYLYAAYAFEIPGGRLALGIGAGIPFGSGIAWPADAWVGRFEITSIGLRVYEGTLTAAFSPTALEGFSVAVGPRLSFSTVELARRVDAVSQEGSVRLGGEAVGGGAQVALAYQPFSALSLGATYRSRVELAFAGAAHFDDIPIELSTRAHDGDVRTHMTLPDRLAFGGAYTFGAGTLSADLEVTLWSTMQELVIDFADEATPDTHQARNWRDVLALRAGYEHRDVFTRGLSLRGGIAWDQSPAPSDTLSPSSPDGDRVLLTGGAGYEIPGWGLGVHVAYAHVFIGGAEATGNEALAGSYDASADLFSFGVAFRSDAMGGE